MIRQLLLLIILLILQLGCGSNNPFIVDKFKNSYFSGDTLAITFLDDALYINSSAYHFLTDSNKSTKTNFESIFLKLFEKQLKSSLIEQLKKFKYVMLSKELDTSQIKKQIIQITEEWKDDKPFKYKWEYSYFPKKFSIIQTSPRADYVLIINKLDLKYINEATLINQLESDIDLCLWENRHGELVFFKKLKTTNFVQFELTLSEFTEHIQAIISNILDDTPIEG